MYQYTIGQDGTLSDKQLFVSVGADGMTMDSLGNAYLCEDGVKVYNASGTFLGTIRIEEPTNVCFGGIDGQTLFIITKSSLYALEMAVSGASFTPGSPEPDCSGDTVVIEDVIFPEGSDCECIAAISITAGPGIIVKSGAKVTFKAPVIKMTAGVHVEQGALFITSR